MNTKWQSYFIFKHYKRFFFERTKCIDPPSPTFLRRKKPAVLNSHAMAWEFSTTGFFRRPAFQARVRLKTYGTVRSRAPSSR